MINDQSMSVCDKDNVPEQLLAADDKVGALSRLFLGQVDPGIAAARALTAVLTARTVGRPETITGSSGRVTGLQFYGGHFGELRRLLGHAGPAPRRSLTSYATFLARLLEEYLGGTVTVDAHPARPAVCPCDVCAEDVYDVSPLTLLQTSRLVTLLEAR
jgi:hypothetical protein